MFDMLLFIEEKIPLKQGLKQIYSETIKDGKFY